MTFIWGLLAHAYAFFNSNFSHDCLNSMMGGAIEEKWKVELGRYFVPVYRAILRGNITLPWVIGVLGLLWTGFAVCLTIKLFDIKKKVVIVLIAGVMVTNITYISQIATYLYEFDFDAFALLMAVAAVYVWKKWNGQRGIIVGSIFIMMSIGIYQAYFAVALTLVICVCLKELFDETTIREIVLNGIKAIAMFLCGGTLYFITGKIIYRMMNLVQQSRTDVFDFSEIGNPIKYYVVLLLKTLIDLPKRLLHAAYPTGIIYTIVIVMICIISILLIYTFTHKKMESTRVIIIFMLLAALALSMNSIHFLSRGEAHDLMIYSVWLFYVIVLLYTQWFSEEKSITSKWRKIPQIIACILVAIVLWQNIIISNTAYLKKDLEAKSTLATMTRVVAMMEEQEGYEYGETVIAFVGANHVYGNIDKFDRVRNITGLRANNALSSDSVTPRYNTYRSYLTNVLNYPINIVEEEKRIELKENVIVKNMPSFPEKGCMMLIDDILVVKMGDY